MSELERIAERLARSLGHDSRCTQIQVGCSCGCARWQADALLDYERYKRALKELRTR